MILFKETNHERQSNHHAIDQRNQQRPLHHRDENHSLAIMDYLKSALSHDVIKQDFLLSDEQLHAALQYLVAHREELEHHYAAIVRRSEERRAHYERLYARARNSRRTCQTQKKQR